MAGRKGPKSGSKKLRVSSDVKKKAMKKLKARRPENLVDLTAVSKAKVLTIDSRGQDVDRLVKRMMNNSEEANDNDLTEALLLMRDGLLQKRLEGLGKIAERVVLDIDRIGSWGKRIIQEIGPRIADPERTVRQYAVQIMVTLVEGISEREASSSLGEPVHLYVDGLISHLRGAFTSIQESISRDALMYLHQLLIYDVKLRNHQDFVKKILPMLMTHVKLVHSGVMQKKVNKKLWGSVHFFSNALQPALSDWASLFCGCLLLCFCSICHVDTSDSDPITVSQILEKLKSPSVRPSHDNDLIPIANPSCSALSKKNHDDFKEITVLGSDFTLGLLIQTVDSLINAAKPLEDSKLKCRVASLAIAIARWIINISFGAELDKTGDLLDGECLPPRTHRTKEFYDSCVSAGPKLKYSLSWLFKKLSLATSIKNIYKLIADEGCAADFAKQHLECLIAETLQAIDVVAHEEIDLHTRVHAHLDPLIGSSPYLGSGRGLVWDTYSILDKVFGKLAIPTRIRHEFLKGNARPLPTDANANA